MSSPRFRLDVLVSSRERQSVVAGAEQFSEALAGAFDTPPPIELRFLAPSAPVPADAAPATVLSPFLDLRPLAQPFETVAHVWRRRVEAMADQGGTVVLLTGFRHVADDPTKPAVLRRIRQLNGLVIELSHSYGARVADLDRALGFFGGRTIEADYRLGSVKAAEIAGHAIALSLIDAMPAYGIADADWQGAMDRHGGFFGMAATVDRRLAAKAARRNP